MYTKTGIEGFDVLLEGNGALENNVYMVKGVPGSGKTTFGMEFIYKGITECGEPGIIISFEESPTQLYRDALRLGWDFKECEKNNMLRVICTSPGSILQSSFIGMDGFLTRMIREMGVKRIVVDSITHFKRISKDEIEYRENLYKFVNGIKSKNTTVFVIAEYDKDSDISDYVVDGVIYMRNSKNEGHKNRRSVEIFKTRGQEHISGEHYFEIEKGIKVYPMIKKESLQKEKIEIKNEVVSTGVEDIDKILKGGYIKGTLNIVVGSTGVGKTIFATGFLKNGIELNEEVVYISFEENIEKYYKFMKNMGWEFGSEQAEKLFQFWHEYGEDIIIEKFLYKLEKHFSEKKVKRVVVDTLDSMFFNLDDNKKKKYLNSLKYIFEKYGITAICLTEENKITGDIEISEAGYSFIADSIILLRYIEVESNIRRILMVLKARGIDQDKKITEYEIIKDKGIVIKDKLLGLSGLMTGNTKGELKQSIEEIFQPLVFLDSFSDYMKEDLSIEEREETSKNMKEVIENLKSKLKEYFKIKEGDIVGI